MRDFHHRLTDIRHNVANQAAKSWVHPEYWNAVVGSIEWQVWFTVTTQVSPRGINITILENINAP